MTRRRWMADEVSGNHAALTGRHAEHLARVLRARAGQEFDITTGTGVRRGRIVSIEESRVEFELGEDVPAPCIPDVTVALSIFRFDRMEWAIEKCTELGAARIVPVVTRRTEGHLAAASSKRRERWQRIAVQASEQSRRTSTPEILQPLKLKDALELTGGLRIVLAESEKTVTLKDALQSSSAGDVVLAIGPEGGWTDAETEMFRTAGWIPVSLGSTILRAETAAVAALAIVLSGIGM